MTPKAAAQAVFSNDPDHCNPFMIGSAKAAEFDHEMSLLEMYESHGY